jgi:hypothetical protein
LGSLLFRPGRSRRPHWDVGLVLFNEFAREDALLRVASGIDVLALQPVVVDDLCDVDDLAAGEAQVVVLLRFKVVQCLDLEQRRHAVGAVGGGGRACEDVPRAIRYADGRWGQCQEGVVVSVCISTLAGGAVSIKRR